MQVKNLNQVKIDHDTSYENQTDHTATFDNVEHVKIIFKDLKSHLIEEINKADVVVGCVAWLTEPDILKALQRPKVSIVVQKEDFLRPDCNIKTKAWSKHLRGLYDKLKPLYWHMGSYEAVNTILDGINMNSGDEDKEAIRCAGNHNSDKNPAFPRMHNKFIVLCHHETEEHDDDDDDLDYQRMVVKPYALWTGSFNFTINGGNSLENAVLIYDERIAQVAFHEYEQIMLLSEPLNWNSEWCASDLRLGS